jgi:F-type H+-transporting ATPase subunit 6
MFSRVLVLTTLRRAAVGKCLTRNIGVSAACYQPAAATDPIQKLFVDKIHDYATKSKAAGGKLVDASPATEKTLTDELEKLARQYGAKGAEFQKFPTFSFTDPDLDAVGVQVEIKSAEAAEHSAETVKDEDADKPFFEP